jgi:hypothetical protein
MKDRLIQELIANKQFDLADAISDLTDVDAVNYIAANKSYFTKHYNNDDLKQMPLFRKALFGQLKTGNVDLDKEFGKDWDKKFNEIPIQQIQYVADEQGIDYKDLTNKMAKEATSRARERISKGEWDSNDPLYKNIANQIGGKALSLFGRRQQEAIARGESPSEYDIAGDIGEQAIYALPYARMAGAIGKGGRIANLLSGGAGIAAAPIITEVYDTNVYDDPNNPRSEFSGWDVGTGMAVNATTPWLVRGGMMAGGKLVGAGRNAVRKWTEFANSPTSKEVAEEINKPYSTYKVSNLNNPEVSKAERDMAKQMESISGTPEYVAYIRDIYNKVAQQEGKTLQDKVNNYLKTKPGKHKYMLADGTVLSAETEADLVKQIQNSKEPVPAEWLIRKKLPNVSDEFVAGWDKSPFSATEGLKTSGQLAKEEAVKNYLTNEYGATNYRQQDPYTRIPFGIGYALSDYKKEQEKLEQQKAEEQEILEGLRKRGLILDILEGR